MVLSRYLMKDKHNYFIHEGDTVQYNLIQYTDRSKTEVESVGESLIGTIEFLEGLWLGLRLPNGKTHTFIPHLISSEEFELIEPFEWED